MAFALIYTVLTIMALAIGQVFGSNSPDRVLEASLGVFGATFCVGPVALVLGLMPGIVLGASGGLLIGVVLSAIPDLTPIRGALVGLAVALLIVVLAHVFLAPGLLDSPEFGLRRFFPYVYWLAIPGLLMVLGLTWVGWKAVPPPARPATPMES